MYKSDTTGELAKALAIAQGKIEGAKKDSENPFFKSSYADLASIWEACRKPLSDNGLSVVQTTSNNEDYSIVVETTLLHSSGEWITGELGLKAVKEDPQGLGSAITYARRYALAAMVGVAPDDDDGESATDRKPVQKPVQKSVQKPVSGPVQSTPAPPKVELITDPQRRKIFASGHQMGYKDEDIKAMMINRFKVEHSKELTKVQASEMIEAIEAGESVDEKKPIEETNTSKEVDFTETGQPEAS